MDIRTEDEYSLQHYSFTPGEFFEDYADALLGTMATFVQQAAEEFSAPDCGNLDKNYCIRNVMALHDTWSQHAMVTLKRLQPIVRDVFTIPRNVLLPMDKVQQHQCTEEDIVQLKVRVDELNKTCLEKIEELLSLKAEIQVLNKLEPFHKMVDEGVHKLHQFEETLNEANQQEKLAQMCLGLVYDVDDSDSSIDDTDIAIQSLKFVANL